MLPFTSTLARSALGAAALVLTTLVMAATAHAGSYSVYACWAGQYGNASWADVTDGVDDTTNGGSCNPSGNAPPFTSDYHGLQMRHGVSPYNQYAYRGAKLQISVPDGGMAITGIEADWRVYCGNTGWYPFAQTSGGYQFRNCGSWGFALSGWNRQGIGGLWDGSLIMGNICGNGAGCNRWVDPPSQLLAKNVRVDMYDPHMPSVPEAHGELWNGGIWHRGSRSLGWSAYDNIGVKRMEYWVQDGAWHKVAETATNEGCNYAYTRPCPQNKSWNVGQVNTAQFSDGAHAVKLRVYDAADNMTDADATLHFDNGTPAKPAAALSAAIKAAPNRGILDGQDTGWQVTRNIALSYPTNGPTASGIASSETQVCPKASPFAGSGNGCFTISTAGNGLTTSTGQVPADGYGEWKARVRLRNNSGTDGAWSDEVPFKYDPRTPGTADLPRNELVEHNGWVNNTTATDFPQGAKMAAGQEKLSSGAKIAGYSVTVQKPGEAAADPDGDLGDAKDIKAIDPDGESGQVVIANVPEGKTIVKARAIAGNGKAAAAFDTIELKADRRAPDVVITPDVAHETYVDGILHTVTGTDAEAPAPALADGKSGMEAGPSNEPVDHGGYVEISVDGATAATTRGPVATSSSPNGTHTLAYSAVDQAGNRSTVKQLRFTVAGDQDGDSVPDPSDLCPTVAGPPPTGCPAGGPGGNGVGGSSDRAALSSPNGTGKNGDAALAGAKITDLYFVQKRKDEMLRQRRCVRAAGTSKAKRSRCKMGDLAKLTAEYGRRASIRGQLVDSKGDPVVGARIQVLESPKGRGIGQIDKGGVRTRADGTFRYTVAQNATSRSVQFVYKPYIGSDLTADKKKTELTIQAKVRVSFSVRSGVIRFAGVALPGRQLVQIQGRPAGGKWETIKSVRSSSTGRFRGSYRLKQRTGREIELRARLVTADRSVTVGTSRTVTRVAR